MSAHWLALTTLDAQSSSYLEKVAALAVARGVRLRLAYYGDGSCEVGSPLARLERKARALGRRFGQPVEVVNGILQSLDDLRTQVSQSVMTCIPHSPPKVGWFWERQCMIEPLVRLGAAPTLVVRPGRAKDYRSLLVPVSLDADSGTLVKSAVFLAAPCATVEILHVADLPAMAMDSKDGATSIVMEHFLRKARVESSHALTSLTKGLGVVGLHFKHTVVQGDAIDQVVFHHQDNQHDLAIVGGPARKLWWSGVFTPFALRITRLLETDVLIVPRPRSHKVFDWTKWGVK